MATPTIRHPEHGAPNNIWTYPDAAGNTIGYVCRFDQPEGGKQVIPCVMNGVGIKWISFGKPRPLYGLDVLAANPDAQVLVVEGEKACDAARRLLQDTGIVVVTWPGGSKAVKHADWSPLYGRQVILWPDADAKVDRQSGSLKPLNEQAGTAAMLEVAELLTDCKVRILNVGVGELTDGWDLADAEAEGWDAERVLDYIRAHLCKPADLIPPPQDDLEALAELDRQRDAAEREAINSDSLDQYQPPEEPAEPTPFRYLGYDHGVYYYLPVGARQVIPLTPSAHTSSGLMQIAPLSWWQRNHPAKGKSPVDWTAAADACIQAQHRFGIFDPDRIRGRGAWWDDKRAVFHGGDRLLVDGTPTRIDDLTTRYLYENARPLTVQFAEPLSTADAHQFVKLVERLSWERPISARLFAGWMALAPICGALRWRPHAWVTGGSGTGKSFVMDHLVAPLLGPMLLYAQSETTEAGVRQMLRTDALPISLDEFESNSPRDRQRVQGVLALSRQASSESGARIIKGSASGQAIAFSIRSMFLFSSIGLNIQQYSDATRITVLSLVQRPMIPGAFEALSADTGDLITQDYAAAFRARSLALVSIIRANAETFSRCAAAVLGTRRLGDQLGALLAGAYSLHSNRLIGADEARAWVEQQNWDEEKKVGEEPDESRCLRRILQHVVRIDLDERSIGELIERANGEPDKISQRDAIAALLRMGIKVNPRGIVVANGSSSIDKILTDTPWAMNWSSTLARINGANKTAPGRFAPGQPVARGTAIPMSAIKTPEGQGGLDV